MVLLLGKKVIEDDSLCFAEIAGNQHTFDRDVLL